MAIAGSLQSFEAHGAFAPEMIEAKMVYFLLIGNSNMQGRAVLHPDDSVAHPRVFAAEFSTQSARWAKAVDPLFASNSRAGMGPGLTFGRLYADAHPEAQVGLLCLAQPGSWMNSWVAGGPSWNRIWDCRFISEAVPGRSGRYGAALVIFGLEHGWGSRDTYTDTLKRFVAQWRTALKDPLLPFVFLIPTRFPDATMPIGDPELIAAVTSIGSWDTRCHAVRGDDLLNCLQDGEACRFNPDLHYSRTSNELIAARFLDAVTRIEEARVVVGPIRAPGSRAVVKRTDLAGRIVRQPPTTANADNFGFFRLPRGAGNRTGQ